MRRAARVTLLIVGFAACRPARMERQGPGDTATPSDTSALTGEGGASGAEVFSGTWIGGTTGEPTTRVVTWVLQCRYHPASWVLEQRGDSVESYHFPESWEQGIATTDPPISRRGTIGLVRRDTLRLNDGADRYVLRYDSTSGHLRGTLNGQPFWAAQRVITRTQECPAVP